MLKGGGIFINGLGIISPQGTHLSSIFEEIKNSDETYLKFIEPDYSGFIEPNNIRRMSKLLKISLVAAKNCLTDSNISQPDGIITGTGLGCMEDTEKFLKTTLSNEGIMSSPTAFIHSTHNTISSQIAIALKCTGYNSTYVHRFISFESALIDCCLQLKEDESIKNYLIGGMDEMTPMVLDLLNQFQFWKKDKYTGKLFQSETNGTIAGEGSSFFTISNHISSTTYVEIKSLKIIFNEATFSEINNELEIILSENNLEIEEIDLLVMGNNGDLNYDHYYSYFSENFKEQTSIAYFKNLCGEYFTSSAFGLLFTSLIIKNNLIPSSSVIKSGKSKSFKNVIFYNQFHGKNHCIYLLSNVQI